MRTLLATGLLVTLFAVPLACGGGQAANEGAKSPESTASAAPAPVGAAGAPTDNGAGGAGAAASALDAGPATTTTTTLGNGGDLQGAKLTETHTVASTTGSVAPPPPNTSKGPHGHDPGRGPADIRAIVIAHRDEARACYDKALPNHPGIEGDLVIQWTIDPKGAVTQVSEDTARSQITEPTVVACVSDVIKKIQFAPSPGGYETKAFYPFNFHPHKGTQAGATGGQ